MPTSEQRDLRQLLIHCHKPVEIPSRVKNGLRHLALNKGLQKKNALHPNAQDLSLGTRYWGVRGRAELEMLPLTGWTSRRREELFGLVKELNRTVDELDAAVERAAQAGLQ